MSVELLREAHRVNRASYPFRRGWAAARDTDRLLRLAIEATLFVDRSGYVVAARMRNRAGLAYRSRFNAARAVDRLLGAWILAPLPTQSRAAINGCVLDVAGNAIPDLLRRARVTHVAVELRPDNLHDFQLANRSGRWAGFTAYGGFYVSRNAPTEAEVAWIVETLLAHKLTFLVVDTEHHKVGYGFGGQLAWTESLYSMLASKLPQGFPIYDVSFGIHQDASVDNHVAKRRYCAASIRETYSHDGSTWGVEETVAKLEGQGWRPVDVMLGTKSLPVEIPDAKRLRAAGRVRDIWLWAPDHGPAIAALDSGLSL